MDIALKNSKHSIGKSIAQLRKQKGLTQVELAQKLSVSDKAVSKWESGSGHPEITQLPVLAGIFGVSIDYIMTGKEPEEQAISISKIELCAKKDDVELFNSIEHDNLIERDDNKKSILDYLIQYKSKNVSKAFIKKYPAINILSMNGSERGYMWWYTETLLEFLVDNNFIEELESIGAFSYDNRKGNNRINIYTDRYLTTIINSKEVSSEFLKKYFGGFDETAFNKALNLALENKNYQTVHILWDVIQDINKKSIEERIFDESKNSNREQYYFHYVKAPCLRYEAIGTGRHYNYFVITFPLSLLQNLIDNGLIEMAKKANKFNAILGAECIYNEAFEVGEAKSKGLQKEKIEVLNVKENGLLIIDKLLKVKDIEFIKKTLLEHPIHYYELLKKMIDEKDYRAIFKFGVDNGLDFLNELVEGEQAIKERIDRMFCNNSRLGGSLSGVLEKIQTKNYHWINKVKGAYYINQYSVNSISQLLDDLRLARNEIVKIITFEENKKAISGDLTKEFFLKELEKGNYESVIIKLCKKLETILMYDFRRTGTFEEMLKVHCSTFNTTDDEANNYDITTPALLQKLRLERNRIVHPSNKVEEGLTQKELLTCIHYIFSIEKKGVIYG